MTGLDEEADIGVHKRNSHGDVLAIWEDSGAVGTALLDEAKDVVPSTEESATPLARFVSDKHTVRS